MVRKRIEELKSTLHGFVDQSEDLFLVLNCRDADTVMVHKILEGVDQEQPADIVLRFGHTSPTAAGYVDGVVLNVDTQINAVNAAREQEGLAPWPKLPRGCSDATQSPDRRLKAAMQHVRGLFPRDEDHRVLWCFLPATLPAPAGYAEVIGRLLPREGIEPWMHSQRIIARDDRDHPFLVAHLHEKKIEGTLIYHADFRTEAMLDAMAKSVADPQTPEPERMSQLLQLAAIDYAYQRYGQAVEKYGICYGYFERQAKPVQQGLCLGGLADVYLATDQAAKAKQSCQQGLALAAPQGVEGLPVVMLLAAKAGQCSLALKEYSDAEGYFDMASQVAGKLVILEFKVDCMENVGVARAAQGDIGGAVAIWEQAIALCKEGDYFVRWRTILDHLVDLYRTRGLTTKQRAAEAQKAGVEQICKERYR